MKKFDYNQEWKFITTETHKKFSKSYTAKREILFALQVLLSRLDFHNYFALKEIYCKN